MMLNRAEPPSEPSNAGELRYPRNAQGYVPVDGLKIARLAVLRGISGAGAKAKRIGLSKRTFEEMVRNGRAREPYHCQPPKFEGICTKAGIVPEEILWGSDSRFERLVRDIRGKSVNLFETLIAERTEFFAPHSRDFVFERIDKLQESSPASYIVIAGDPGAGKSTIGARYADKHECARHFNAISDGITSPKEAVRNICLQVIGGYTADDVSSEPSSTSDIDAAYLQRVLKRASDGNRTERILIVIDALDEVDIRQQDTCSNVLYLPQVLPPRVHVVVSTRRVSELRLVTSPAIAREDIDLSEYPEDNERDATSYLHYRFEQDEELRGKFEVWRKSQKLKVEKAIDAIVDHSKCNFMYLRYAIDAIRDQQLPALSKLPKGLSNYYADHLRRMRANDAHRLKVIVALALRRLKRTSEELAKITGLDLISVEQTLKEWRPFLRIEKDANETRRYGFYHASFAEFLLEDPEVQAARSQLNELDSSVSASDLEDCGWL